MGHLGRLLPKLILTVLIGVAGVCTSALADKVALVVGNGSYQNVAMLHNPPNDASDIAASLRRLGFSVTILINARFDDMRLALLDFGRNARGAEMAVVFYAGHGMEIGGENWLIPVDAELHADTDAENEAISLRSVVLQVATATNLGLVILDACRNNPFAAKMQRLIRTRAVERGLVQIEPTDNVLVAFSAKDGTTSNDGDGRNSPFTAALLKNLETPGLEINFMFRNVRDDVMAATKREQQPFVYGSLSKEAIYLKPPTLGQTAVPLAGTNPTSGPAQADIAWNLMKDTKDIEVLQSFIRQFPNGPRLAEAKARIAALMTAPIEVPFNEAKVRALAIKQSLPLPESLRVVSPSSAVPKKAVEYLGAWGGSQRWGGGGRQMLLVVTNIDESGVAIGVITEGPPTPNTFNQNPAHYNAFEGTITDHGLSFAYGGMWNYTFKIRPDGMMDGQSYGPQNRRPTITIERIN